MSSNNPPRSTHTVASRLTLWYALFYTLFCLVMLLAVTAVMNSNAVKRMDQYLSAEIDEFNAIYETDGIEGLAKEFRQEAEAYGAQKLFCRLLSPNREPRLTSNIAGWEGLDAELRAVAVPTVPLQPAFQMLYPAASPFNARMATLKTADGHLLQFGINLQSENRSRQKIQRFLIIGSVLFLGVSTLFSWVVAQRAMAGVKAVTRAVSFTRKDALDQTLPREKKGREIDDLVDAFNGMLARIQSLILEIKEVSDNVAHDLRSPITRMRGAAETTLMGPQEIEPYREMGSTILEECDRLTGIINITLEIAQAESGLLEIRRNPIDLYALLTDAAELFQPVAEQKNIRLDVRIAPAPLTLPGDQTRIQRVVANLLDNAIKYTPEGGEIVLAATADKQSVRFSISDAGPGIDPAETERIFERFYRGEQSRSSQGNGLGLSFARSIVVAHGGTLTVENNPDHGCTFTATLPLVPPETR
ncbi:sensor histidine kinase [Pontiella sp.]|uniref:sensor histidine kinase n=1 Tax=Pontiella sp. TaxID=2837462 RepID=UPI003563E489